MKFVVEGVMNLGNEERKFSKEVEAGSEKLAKERALTLLGSNHGVKRSRIKIEKVEKA